MSWRDAAVRLIGGVTQRDLQAALAQAKEQLPLLGGADPGAGFRRISEQPDRDLQPLARDREVELAYYLYKTNILGGRMVDLKRDFVVGDGFSVTSDVPEVMAAIADFWQDPVNRMDETLPQKVLELGLYGEQAYPVFVTPNMGRVRLGYLDPAQIDQVWADPENAAILVGIETKGTGGRRRRYPIVISAEERSVLSPAAQRLRLSFQDNPCFFFSVNRVTNATRGSSDLLRALDWLTAYEEWMFDRLEWFGRLSSFIWDVLLKGMNDEQIRKWLAENPPPRPNSIRAHNENVTWQAVNPDLKTVDVAEGARLFRNHILSSDGWPEHWFTSGTDVNRASAVEMGDPIVKSLTARQRVCIAMVRAEIRYMLRSRAEAGSLPRTVQITKGEETRTVAPWEAFAISAPEIASRDLSRLGGVIVQVAQSLSIAQNQQWIGHEDAAGVFALVASMFGREVTPAKAPDEAAGGPGSEDYTAKMLALVREAMGRGSRRDAEPQRVGSQNGGNGA